MSDYIYAVIKRERFKTVKYRRLKRCHAVWDYEITDYCRNTRIRNINPITTRKGASELVENYFESYHPGEKVIVECTGRDLIHYYSDK